jgi:hypothetical protein
MRPKSPYLASTRSSRRSVLKGAMVGTAGVAGVAGLAAAGVIFTQPKNEKTAAHAAALVSPDSVQTILNIAATAETLAVLFYTQGLAHANKLFLSTPAFLDLEAALLEEITHLNFLLKQGAKPLTKTFSFPKGADTFKDLGKFIQTQQTLETLFVAAYIVAAKEFAMAQRPDLVQIAGQIGAIEAEHRALGRAIGGLRPADNEAFAPVHLKKVSDAPTVLKNTGFLTPKKGNTFTYTPSKMNMDGVIDLTPQA